MRLPMHGACEHTPDIYAPVLPRLAGEVPQRGGGGLWICAYLLEGALATRPPPPFGHLPRFAEGGQSNALDRTCCPRMCTLRRHALWP
jgi:hypothetical protein